MISGEISPRGRMSNQIRSEYLPPPSIYINTPVNYLKYLKRGHAPVQIIQIIQEGHYVYIRPCNQVIRR